MTTDQIPRDPVRFVVGVVFAATLSTVLVGMMSMPGLQWALGRGDPAARVAVAVVVGYGFVLAWQLRQSDGETAESSGLQMLGRGLLAVTIYSGIVAFAAVALPAVGNLLGLSTDAVVFMGLFYPWWEELTTLDALPAPVPLSVTGVAVYTLASLLLARLAVRNVLRSDDGDKDPNVRRGSERVATWRRWPTVFVNRDSLFGRSSSR
ncbi:hypothetical protein [Halobaculum sp. MBLA0143]|uniref:hypothetical protein n=1 Tax=Halobaculum sp. MBLA0143 TaxID=3079933 RepID=UPI0035260248